ncbi:tetratricopeptide repeat protein [Pseudomonadota bacterium]
MTQNLIENAFALIQKNRFQDALRLLHQVIDQDASHWNAWYLAGQCYRFEGDLDNAVRHLSHAVKLKTDDSSVFLALGIVFQLRSQWGEAIDAFQRAIELDPNYANAYNSLALTQKKKGDFEKALHTYEEGVKARVRQIVVSMRNDPSSRILKHQETTGSLWIQHATYGAIYIISSDSGIDSMAWMNGKQAAEEERYETHAGLYWVDKVDNKNATVRLFLPNYFNTFLQQLAQDPTYSNLMGNRGTVLELVGREEEAQQHFDEATEFQGLFSTIR